MDVRYVGHGDYLLGIPARSLNAADWRALSDEQQEQVRHSTLYEMVPEVEPEPESDPPITATEAVAEEPATTTKEDAS